MSVSPAAGRILRDFSLGKLPMALRGDYALLLLHDFTANQEDRDEESPKFRWTKPNTIQESAVALTIRAAEARVLDVAVACGFKTQQHFARVFRRMCGASPTEYRRQFQY